MTNAIVRPSYLQHLDRGWRLVGTALSFLAFGVGAVIGFICVPILTLVIRNRQRRHRITRRFVHAGYALHVAIMRSVGVLTYDVSGRENIQDLNGCLIVANHPSLIDVVFLLSTFRDANCVVKSSFWHHPVTAATVKAADYIPNDDPVQVMDECISRLRLGTQLVLFPEGTRTRPGHGPEFGRAAATMALRAGVPVLPVRISCEPTTLTKSEPWYRIPSRQVRFEAQILPPIDTQALRTESKSERDASVNLTGKLMQLLGGHADPQTAPQ